MKGDNCALMDSKKKTPKNVLKQHEPKKIVAQKLADNVYRIEIRRPPSPKLTGSRLRSLYCE
ncbi:MAG: hypothetical protein WC477_02735 [Patescibacteria group bacterium]